MAETARARPLGAFPRAEGLGAIKRNRKGQLSGVPCPRLDVSKASKKEVNSNQDKERAEKQGTAWSRTNMLFQGV